jgi:hypothetical protein
VGPGVFYLIGWFKVGDVGSSLMMGVFDVTVFFSDVLSRNKGIGFPEQVKEVERAGSDAVGFVEVMDKVTVGMGGKDAPTVVLEMS